jgi:hypothetical protein
MAMRGRKKIPKEKARMMDSLKIARVEIIKRVYEALPPQLRISDGELIQLTRAIAEQINYATASSKFIGDDKQMLRKLEALVTDLRLIGGNEAASELISAVKMRPNYLALVESIMR